MSDLPPAEMDNPAGRMANFFADLQRAAAEHAGQPPMNQQARAAMLRAIGLPSATPTEWYAKLAVITNLPRQLRDAIAVAPELRPEYSRLLLPEVDAYFARLVDFQWSQASINLTQPITPTLVLGLRFCSADLHQSHPEHIPDADAIAEIRADIETLIDDLRTAPVDMALAAFLARELHDLLRAIDDFTIAGITPAREAFAHVVGEVQMYVQPEAAGRDPARDEAAASLGARFFEILRKYSIVVQMGLGAAQLAETAMLALTTGAHGH